ncbi:MAG: serine hydrolase domain-containing protein [Acidobacteriota bacterium]
MRAAIRFLFLLPALSLACALGTEPSSQGLPAANPEQVGLSSQRLSRIGPVMQKYIDEKKVAGVLTMVARDGKVVHFEARGLMDIENNKKMAPDTIFRIYSMTKPVTSIALMMLYEEGRFRLSDPASKFIPEFEDLKVYAGGPKENMRLAELERPVTIHHLLTHTSGLTYGLFGNHPVDQLYLEANLFDTEVPTKEMAQKVLKLPLAGQPGTVFNYSVSTDILGHLIERISGRRFDEFLKERIFEPLKMKDTGFYVPAGKLDRFAVLYDVKEDGRLELSDAPATGSFAKPPAFLSGGGGLVSTASDYLRFAAMVLNGGELDGIRLLSRKTIELMTTNHLPDELVPIHVAGHPIDGYGFGLGFAVRVDLAQAASLGSVGMYFWSGMANTGFWIDPEEKLIAIIMAQYLPYGLYPLRDRFQTLTYQAIVD